ncbi:MAG: ROK family protein [Anaerolineae bacterium]
MRDEPFPRLTVTGRGIGNIKSHNLRAVLLALLHQGALSRVRLTQLTGLSSTTITNLTADLLAQGIIAETGKEDVAETRGGNGRPGAGRPPTLISIRPTARYAAGIHFGVDTIRAGVTDLFGNLHGYQVVAHPTDIAPAELLERAVALAEEVIARAGVQRESLVGLGVGASGLVDPESGVNVLAPNLGWRNVPMRAFFAGRTGLPVMVDNNVRAMALAEAMFGAGRGINTLAFVYGRVGVGAGFVVGGNVYRGSRAGAGEIGHTTMIPAGGAPCRCGNTGCLETLVSEPALVRQAHGLAARVPDSLLAALLQRATAGPGPHAPDGSSPAEAPIELVFAAARGGDRAALELLDQAATYLGTALANLVNLVNPDMIILGGMFAAGADLFLPRVEETMRRRSFAGLGDQVALRVTTFGRKVGVIGAAALALDAFFYRQEAPAEP